MTVIELIAKLQELAKYRPDTPVTIYVGEHEDFAEVETVGVWSVYDDDNSFVVLNNPEDKVKDDRQS